MSNRQKYLSVLSAMIQVKAPTPRAAWKSTEENFQTNLEMIKKLSVEDQSEMLTYAIMGLNALHNLHESTLMHDIMLDDMRTFMHAQTCPRCKAKPEHDGSCEGDESEPGPPTLQPMSMEDFMEMFANSRKPS